MSDANTPHSPLPYTDTKPVGHADFYFAINATFRFIQRHQGEGALKQYWRDMGLNYCRPVTKRWFEQGLTGVAEYWRAFFQAEPGAEVEVIDSGDEVRLEVKRCPAIHHLREHGREIVPVFCQHCYFVNEAMAESAGLTVRVCGGNGACSQRFTRQTTGLAPQNLEAITTAS